MGVPKEGIGFSYYTFVGTAKVETPPVTPPADDNVTPDEDDKDTNKPETDDDKDETDKAPVSTGEPSGYLLWIALAGMMALG
ncbi:MAG: hypothetical protein J6Q42_03030 [Clostridia bacterium]|nr:hypothetical protein [Clostridia bacterium]